MLNRASLTIIYMLSLIFAVAAVSDEVTLRTIVTRNEAVVGGEFHVDLQIRISQGTAPQTLGALTCDIYYGPELAAYADTPATNWVIGTANGYSRDVARLPNYYRVLVTGGSVNEDNLPNPPGNPAGWNVTETYQTLVTLRWTIKTVAMVSIMIYDLSDASSYFANLTNAPQGLLVNWSVNNEDLGDIPLPLELALFSAESFDDHIRLKWTTLSESKNLGFHIFRAESASGSYRQITEQLIPGAGNSTTPRHYSYTDRSVKMDMTYYYKLGHIDLDGRIITHGPIRVSVSAPDVYALEQNYPNPFNGKTKIDFAVQESGFVILDIFNVNGQVVKNLLSAELNSGKHFVSWDGRDEKGGLVPSGIYLCKLHVNDFEHTIKMQFLK